MTTTLQVVALALGIVISTATIVGLGVRYVLVPYLRDHLITPMKKVEKQVTENSHKNAEPTLLDLFADLRTDLGDLRKDVANVDSRFDEHLSWSHERVQTFEVDMARLAGEVEVLKAK